ncbi:hypothetical protein [Roseivirga pacifica]|uniref:hypothetical protein n=1 Tax=Roseivirga pacifica TaxID=1267423 RepID=UPI003BA92491
MEELKSMSTKIIKNARTNPEDYDLALVEYGKSPNIRDYSRGEIIEMLYGIYKDKCFMKVDAGYFINLKDVEKTICRLEKVSVYNKAKYEKTDNKEFSIKNVRTFYVSDYFLETKNEISGNKQHSIVELLCKIGAISTGKNEYEGLYGIRNDYGTFQQYNEGKYPKDLFHPIKIYINGLFFQDEYRISDFIVESDLIIKKPLR